MAFLTFYTPKDLGEAAFIESLFKAHDIRYFINNENAGRIYPGMSFDQISIQVYDDDFDKAAELLKDKIGIVQPKDIDTEKTRRFIIVIISMILFVCSFYFVVTRFAI